MARVITIAGTAITSTSDLDSIKVGGQAKQGDSGIYEVIVYDDSNALFGTAESFIRKQWSVTENASGTAVYLGRGRIAAFESHRGDEDSVQGTKVQYTWALEDANLELRGHDVHNWVRPAENGYTRVRALGTAYLNGSPRTSTNLNTTTYVPLTNGVSMPAKTYNNADAIDVVIECAATEDKKFFVTVDHELFYDLDTSTAYAAIPEISDGVAGAAAPDGTNYFAPIWDLGSALSWEGQDYASRIRLSYLDSSVLVTDATSEAAHDRWVAQVFDQETTNAAQATSVANAELVFRKGGERTYALSLKIPAEQAYKIKYGQVIWIQSQAAVDTTARVRRRIADLAWEPDGPFWYIARLNLDRPVRKRARGSVRGAPVTTSQPATGTSSWIAFRGSGFYENGFTVNGTQGLYKPFGFAGDGKIYVNPTGGIAPTWEVTGDLTLYSEFFGQAFASLRLFEASGVDQASDPLVTFAHVRFNSDTQIKVMTSIGGPTTDTAGYNVPGTTILYDPGTDTVSNPLKFRIRFEAGVLRSRTWRSVDAEPGTWDESLTDSFASFHYSLAWKYNGEGASGPRVEYTLDNLAITVGGSGTETFTRTVGAGGWGTCEIANNTPATLGLYY